MHLPKRMTLYLTKTMRNNTPMSQTFNVKNLFLVWRKTTHETS
jgi:hypothetical protein